MTIDGARAFWGMVALISSAMAPAPPSIPPPIKVAGEIEYWDGNSKQDYKLFHKDQLTPTPIECGMDLLIGDEVQVKNDKVFIVLKFEGRPPVYLCHPSATNPKCTSKKGMYKVTEGDLGKAQGTLHAIRRELKSWMTKVLDNRRTTSRNLVVRGERPIQVPLLEGDNIALAAGTRTLRLAWERGTPPYQIVISREGMSDIFLGKNIKGRTLLRRNISLEAGTYRIQISASASAGYSFEKNFRVVPPSEVPLTSAEFGQGTTELEQVFKAAWLSSQENGKWRWEAYLRTSELPEDFVPAQALRRALQKGQQPSLSN